MGSWVCGHSMGSPGSHVPGNRSQSTHTPTSHPVPHIHLSPPSCPSLPHQLCACRSGAWHSASRWRQEVRYPMTGSPVAPPTLGCGDSACFWGEPCPQPLFLLLGILPRCPPGLGPVADPAPADTIKAVNFSPTFCSVQCLWKDEGVGLPLSLGLGASSRLLVQCGPGGHWESPQRPVVTNGCCPRATGIILPGPPQLLSVPALSTLASDASPQ